MDAGRITKGTVDGRSIKDVAPADVAGFRRAHFFAGIAGWDYALELAGWGDAEVWTGSCPCQPFSVAGKGKGTDDERHLWPEWFRLIRECRPPVVFGEQVASPAGLAWLDAVSADLEGEGYAFGAADLAAASVGSPHGRQRLFFVAYADRQRRDGFDSLLHERGQDEDCVEAARGGEAGSVDVSEVQRRERHAGLRWQARSGSEHASLVGHAERDGGGRHTGATTRAEAQSAGARLLTGRVGDEPLAASATRGMGHANGAGPQGRVRRSDEGASERVAGPSSLDGPWARAEWIACTDGKSRPIEPGSFPLVDGFPGRVAQLRPLGNAIVPQVAATFIRAAMDCLSS